MPSPSIVQGIRRRIQKQLIPSVSSRWSKQLNFGLQAYGLKAFQIEDLATNLLSPTW